MAKPPLWTVGEMVKAVRGKCSLSSGTTVSGVSIDIPVGTAFQYRCTGVNALQFLCVSMPRWPGEKEATVIEGPWRPTAPKG